MSSTTQPAPRGSAAASQAGSSRSTTSGSARSTSGWAGVFFVIAGDPDTADAAPDDAAERVDPRDRTYEGVLTMHGTLLVFFVLVPVVIGLATFLVPLLIGASADRDARARRGGALAVRLRRRAIVLSAFAGGGSSQAGWTGYPPAALARRATASTSG